MAGEKILVVDDEKMIRDLCAHILTSEGYVVSTMPNGEAALAELGRNASDRLDAMRWNEWPPCVGMSGRIQSESVAGMSGISSCYRIVL